MNRKLDENIKNDLKVLRADFRLPNPPEPAPTPVYLINKPYYDRMREKIYGKGATSGRIFL